MQEILRNFTTSDKEVMEGTLVVYPEYVWVYQLSTNTQVKV